MLSTGTVTASGQVKQKPVSLRGKSGGKNTSRNNEVKMPRAPRKARKKKITETASALTAKETEGKENAVKIPPSELIPNTYYWALYYGEPEIVLTSKSGQTFYIHGDEFARKTDNVGVEFRKKIWTKKAIRDEKSS